MREISDAFDCTIYVDADLEGDDLGPLLTERLGGTFAPRTYRRSSQEGTIEHDFTQVEIEFNSHDADPVPAMDFPDGFLHFPLRIEIYAVIGQEQALHEQWVPDALRTLWSADHAAVAACDYEYDLPELGGVESRAIPWPGR